MSKKLLTSFILAGVALSLVACSPASPEESGAADCTPAASGASSDKVDVSGDFGSEPTVDFTSPVTASTTERSVITEGSGDIAVSGSTVTVDFSAFNATSGDPIEATTYEADGQQQFTLDETKLLPGLLAAIQCSSTGERVVAVIPPADAFGDTGQTDLGVGATDSMVFVIDIVEIAPPVKALPRADGEDQPPVEGIPTVELAEDGAPTISIPATDPPADLKIEALKVGDGTVVAEGDSVTVHYTGVIWATGEVFDSSWTLGEPTSFATTDVIPGFGKALVGQTVGSQVIAVIPPSEGYGEAGSGDLIGGTDTLVFVVDILATQ